MPVDLRLLKRAIYIVFLLLFLGCASADEESCDNGLERGKELLEINKLEEAADMFACALESDPNNYELNFWRGTTRIASLLEDPEVESMFRRFGATGNLDPWDWGVKFPRPQAEENPSFYPDDSPSLTEVLILAKSVVIPEIDGAIKNLAKIEQNSSFQVVVSKEIMPRKDDSGPLEQDTEVDIADIYNMISQLYATKAEIQFLDSYRVESDSDKALNDNCFNLSSYLNQYPELLTLKSENERQLLLSKDNYYYSLLYYRSFLNAVSEEREDQSDDLYTIETSSDMADQLEWVNDMLSSLEGPTIAEIGPEDDKREVNIYLARLFTDPVDRSFLPLLFFDEPNCKNEVIDDTFKDPTMNGVFPDFDQSDASWLLGYVLDDILFTD